jgi:hypothetical protein
MHFYKHQMTSFLCHCLAIIQTDANKKKIINVCLEQNFVAFICTDKPQNLVQHKEHNRSEILWKKTSICAYKCQRTSHFEWIYGNLYQRKCQIHSMKLWLISSQMI